MRGKRTVMVTAVVGALVVVTPTEAAANGGAYLDFDRTHYLPGGSGVTSVYVSVPRKKEFLFDRGPFYVFVLPQGMLLEEGQAIPDAAVRIGLMTIEEEKRSYELSAEFTVPELASGYYSVAVCNDPCTISGFRETISGSISIVATEREARLLTENERLRSRVFGFRHEARRAERRVERLREELDLQLSFGASERERMSKEISRLEERLAGMRRVNEASRRSPLDPWLVGAILLVTAAAAVLAFRRRRMLASAPHGLETIVGTEAGSAASLNGGLRTGSRSSARSAGAASDLRGDGPRPDRERRGSGVPRAPTR